MRSRDRRFDGRFFVGVRTTGIYCRPICPAPTPKLENVDFYACAAAAEDAGFRPCRRCRPETAPGTPAWIGSSARGGPRAAPHPRGRARRRRRRRPGRTPRRSARARLRRLFEQHLGTSPAAIARARRVHFARVLVDQSDLPMTGVAFAAGFRSVRQFNHAVRSTFGDAPRAAAPAPPKRAAARRAADHTPAVPAAARLARRCWRFSPRG